MRISVLVPLVVASLYATPFAASAQDLKIPVVIGGAPADRVLAAPMLPAPAISMSDAVRLTVENDASVALARQDVAAAGGRLRESKGPFDQLVTVRTSFGWNHTALRPFLRHREEDKRTQFATLASVFGTVDAGLRKSLAGLTPRTPTCPVGFDFSIAGSLVPSINVDRQDTAELNLMGINRDLGNPVGQSVIRGFSPTSVAGVCTPPGKIGFPLEEYRNLWGAADAAAGGNLGLNQFMANGPQYPFEVASTQQQLAQTIATRAALGRARLREVPLDEVRRDVAFEANWDKMRRNGWSYGGQLRLLSNQHTYRGKSLDPSFGGAEDPILFPSYVTLNLTAPIARGGGRRTVEAPEKAADLNLRSESERIRHTISDSTFKTVLAYLNLIAAQERLRYLEESAARQGQVLSATQQLVAAGDQPQTEIGRARARQADAAAAVADGQLAILEARVSLAGSIGVNVAKIDNLPIAQGGFANVLPSIPTTDVLMAAAMNNRRDRRGLQLLKEAAGLLARAAQADRRPRFDATFSGGLSNTYDNPLFHYVPDELFPIFTNLPKPEVPPPSVEPSRFAAFRGFGRSLTGRWEPFFKVAFTYELPFGNNRYGGRALQAQASLQSSTVQAADIDRVILDNVTQAAGALRATAETILRRRETIELQRTTLEGALARMRGGDLSLIDTLTTEDDLKREQVQLVEDQLKYFSTLARLRFETGQLITIDGEGAPAQGLTFSSREFITP